MRAAKVQASLRIRAVSPEPPLLAHTSSESRETFRQKARSLASLNGWACAVKTSWRNALRHKFAWRGSFNNFNNMNYNQCSSPEGIVCQCHLNEMSIWTLLSHLMFYILIVICICINYILKLYDFVAVSVHSVLVFWQSDANANLLLHGTCTIVWRLTDQSSAM